MRHRTCRQSPAFAYGRNTRGHSSSRPLSRGLFRDLADELGVSGTNACSAILDRLAWPPAGPIILWKRANKSYISGIVAALRSVRLQRYKVKAPKRLGLVRFWFPGQDSDLDLANWESGVLPLDHRGTVKAPNTGPYAISFAGSVAAALPSSLPRRRRLAVAGLKPFWSSSTPIRHANIPHFRQETRERRKNMSLDLSPAECGCI